MNLTDFPNLSSDYLMWGNTLANWIIFLCITLGCHLFLVWLHNKSLSIMAKIFSRTKNHIDDAILVALKSTSKLFFFLLAFTVGIQILTVAPKLKHIYNNIFYIAIVIQLALWVNHTIRAYSFKYNEEKLNRNPKQTTAILALSFVSRVLVWIMAILLIFDKFGYNISGLVTGLGIGGIAVALAVQNILSDVFASLSIMIDQPFLIGDFISLDSHMGTVEHIGLKTTRLRSISGELLILSNNDLLKSRIRNMKHMKERRVLFTLQVAYQTELETLQEVKEIIRKNIEAQPHVRLDRVNLKELASAAIIFEIVYFVIEVDYNKFAEIHENINFGILKDFSAKKIYIAYPNQVEILGSLGNYSSGSVIPSTRL